MSISPPALAPVVRTDPTLLVERAFQAHGVPWLLDTLRNGQNSYYLVGGAVRDGLLGEVATDIDIAIPNGDRALHAILSRRGPGVRNRHGNWRYRLSDTRHIDVIEPQNFYRRFVDVESMLSFFDTSVNAVAIDLRSNVIIDPIGGVADLASGRVTLPTDRWTSMNDFESVHLALRVVRLLRRHRLAISNPHLLAAQLPKLDRVDWRDLYRLNGLNQNDARRKITEVCAGVSRAK